jgi:hypothetical protein
MAMDNIGRQFEHNQDCEVARKGLKILPGHTSNQQTITTILASKNASGKIVTNKGFPQNAENDKIVNVAGSV